MTLTEIIPGFYLGNRADARNLTGELDDKGVTSVISVSQKQTRETDYHHPLMDGLNSHANFTNAVDIVVNEYTDGETVFLHCRAGESRSTAVAIAALAKIDDMSFTDAQELIIEKRDVANPNEPLLKHAEEYLGEGSLRSYIVDSDYPADPDEFLDDPT